MRVEVTDYKTGWISVAIRLKERDLQSLIRSLSALQKAEVGQHFHISNQDIDGPRGIIDIAFSRDAESETDTFGAPTSFAKGPTR